MNDINRPLNDQINVPDPVDIYMRYLALEDENKLATRAKLNKKKYSASSAGLCYRKHWYDYNNYPRISKDITFKEDREDMRKMRLGTVMGRDFDDAMQWFIDENLKAQIPNNNIEIYYETAVSHENLNINGHFDLLIVVETVDGPNLVKQGYLYDYKTAHSWKFRNLSKPHLDNNPSNNYEYQLGTYAFMIEDSNEFCDEIVHMENIYINKDDSKICRREAGSQFKEWAKKYWMSVNKYQERSEPPEFSMGDQGRAPYQKWECQHRYCNWADSCPSPYMKENKKRIK